MNQRTFKTWILLINLFSFAFLVSGCQEQSQIKEISDNVSSTFVMNKVQMKFEKSTGKLVSFTNPNMTLNMEGFMIDVGYDNAYLLNLLHYESFDNLQTWDLPKINPSGTAPNKWEFLGFTKDKDAVETNIRIKTLNIKTKYTIVNSDLRISTTITNLKKEPALINGVGYFMKGVETAGDTQFNFPGGVPYKVFSLSGLANNSPIEAGLVNPIVRTVSGHDQFNTVFVNPHEKWGSGVYKDDNNKINYIYLSDTESQLAADQSLNVGDLYIQLNGKKDSYKAVRDLYTQNGWLPPHNGVTEGPVYSLHPGGPMDAPFTTPVSMDEFAKELKPLEDIGIRNVWVLPIFQHSEKGIYNTSDMSEINPIYGSDDAVKTFIDNAHGLGMKVIFDYVPKGPEPLDPLSMEHKDWRSVKPDESLQIEWDCVSFDMANPNYIEYIKNIVKDHVKRFNVDGARIDTAMGGLPNWKPYKGNRPSDSNLKGGVNVSRTIREGFVESGKKPLVLPENFNPVPLYYPYTDLFYDMPLYRVLFDLNQSALSDTDYAVELERWLNEEHLVSPSGLNKLRFLGNHDTVSWVWDKARAPVIYGEEKAKTMWALMSFIDGIPMIYQGDENPANVNMHGPDLRSFFKEIFSAREKWLGSKYDIQYITTNSPIIAFKRFSGNESRLVLINLSQDKQTFKVEQGQKEVVFGNCKINGNKAEVEGFGYCILK